MLKSLRRKFILINMILVSVVLIVVFSALCISNYRRLENDTSVALHNLISIREGQKKPSFEISRKNRQQDFFKDPVFVVRINENSDPFLILSSNISVDDATLKEITQAALDSGNGEGTLAYYNLQFLKMQNPIETKIAFIELSGQQSSMRNILLLSTLSCLAAIVAFFFISLFLSKWALKPTEQAWIQQRRFVADASHELRTPLTIILANLGIMKTNKKDTIEKQMNWVESTEAEATRMKKLVDNLLFLAKADDAKATFIYEKVNLTDLVFNTSLAFESIAFEKGLSLEMNDIAQDTWISGDRSQLKQLILILLDNAVKYSDEKNTITISLSKKQGRAILSVHNFGEDIAFQDVEHIFKRFYRADKARANEGGYGLGLSIAKSIADNHHGRIWAESNPANGTTFTISLPLV